MNNSTQTAEYNLGFIGVGHLADFVIKGLRRGGFTGNIYLLPRSKTIALSLQKEYNCIIVDSTSALLAQTDALCLAVKPNQIESALESVSLRSTQWIISFAAAVDIKAITQLVGQETKVIRAMPMSCAEVCASPTMIFPDDAISRSIIDHSGKTILLPNEEAFTLGSVLACTYASTLELYSRISDYYEQKGLASNITRELVYNTFSGAAEMAKHDLQRNASEYAHEVAVEGTFSKEVLDSLNSQQAFTPWLNAMNVAFDALQK